MKNLLMLTGLTSILISCTNDTVIESKNNSAPTILIVSHSDGAEVQDGYVEYFRATVSDDDNEFDELQVTWYVGENQVCDWSTASPAGDALCEIVFGEGDENVIAEVRDAQGSGGRSEIGITVLPTEVPVAEILSPVGGGSYYSDQLIQFSGLVSDLEDDNEDLMVIWSSSMDGELNLDTTINSNGEISDYTYLTEGNHAIELLVEDTSGKFSTSEVVIQVGGRNSIPVCQIVEPIDGGSVIVGDTVTFRGTADDADIPNNELTVEWSSDKDGIFGTSTPTSSGNITYAFSGLSANTHTISMNVADEVGALCTEQILLEVGNPPSVSIDEPLDGSLVSAGAAVLFRATVSDSEDQPGQLQTVWTSDLDGELQSGPANSQGVTQFSTTTLSAGVHSISLSVTDTSGLISDDLLTLQVNTSPVVDSISFTPDPVFSNVNLTAVPTLVDPDGQNVTATYQWFEDGSLRSFLTSNTVSAGELDVGEIWTVRVTPSDGLVYGNFAEASITIGNTPPVVSQVGISPSSNVYNDTSLTCSGVVTDADQTVVPTYSWSLNGLTYAGAYLDLATTGATPTDMAVCTVTVVDDQGLTDTASASVVIDNRSPSVGTVSIAPSTNVTTQSTVSCSATANDVDGDATTLSYEWVVGSQTLATGSTLDLSSVSVSPNDVLECVATATDANAGVSSGVNSVTVVNTNPVIDALTLTPNPPSATDVVTCSASASDVDGDSPTLTFTFTDINSGAIIVPTSVSTNTATLDLSPLNLTSGSTVQCAVEATDAQGATTISTTSVSVGNSLPSMTSVVISPNANVTTGTQLTCTGVASDPDDGVLTPTYQWTVNGNVVSNTSTYTVNAAETNVGDSIVCTASAADSDGQSVSGTDSITIVNTAPTLSGAPTVSVNQIEFGQTVTCSASASDVDGQIPSISYEWIDQNGSVLSTGTTFQASTASVGDVLTCRVTASDGVATSPALSSTVVDILNTPPTIGNAAISPNSGLTTSSLLTCSASATDVNDGALSVSYSWAASNGQTHSGQTWQLTSSIVGPNDTISCVASAMDSDGGTAVSSPYVVSLNNSAPVVTNVGIVPNSGVYTGTTLTCTANGSDPDDGVLTPTYVWTVNGNTVANGATYTITESQTDVGDVILCTATVTDSDTQTASNTASVTLQNSAPILNGQPILSASQVEIGDVLTCSASGTDIDGDAVSLSYQWLDSSNNVLGSSSSLTVQNLAVGETIRCSVGVSDGVTSGASMTSVSSTVVNSAPQVSVVQVTPSSGLTTSSLLTCSASATDVNDGALSVSYSWAASNGQTHSGQTWQLTSNTVGPGVSITCTASTVDSNGATASRASSPVSLDNSAPSVTNVAITPSSGVYTGTTLTCTANGSDPDDGVLTPTYVWTVNGNTVANGATYQVSASDTDVGSTIVCTASVSDTSGQTASDTSTVSVANTNPTVGSVTITPNSSVTNDATLTCSASVNDVDESIVPSFAWTVNGSALASGATVDLTSFTINPQDFVVCTATAADSNGGLASSTASVSIINRSPTISAPTLSDSTPEANQTLTCSSNASDADGESVGVSYEWTKSGSVVGTNATLSLNPASYAVGDVVVCTVNTADGYGGTASSSAYATIVNSSPTIGTASISPTTGLSTSSLLTCSATASDLNDGALTPTYVWSTSAGVSNVGPTWQLDASFVSPGDTITCMASATDTNGSSVSSNAVSIVLSNSAPSISSISISPNSGVYTNTALTCSATATDPDDGSLSPSYQWTVNGSVVSNSATYTVSSGDTDVGESVVCTASATDSSGQVATGSSSVVVENTTPVLSGISIVPQSGVAIVYVNDDTLLCSVTVTDPDENLSADFEWLINGTNVVGGSTIDLTAFSVEPTDVVTCLASVSDSQGGTDTLSDTATIGNRPPTIGSVSINNTSPEANDTITCSGSAFDPDGTALSSSYTWTINGNTVGTSASLTLDSSMLPGVSLLCTYAVTDAHNGSASGAASAIVVNSDPTMSIPTISPSSGIYTTSALTCSGSATDLNDGALSVTYSWSSTNGQTDSGRTLQLSNSLYSPGDEVFCITEAMDSDGAFVTRSSAAVIIENQQPNVYNTSISPNIDVHIGVQLTCSASAIDAEDGTLSATYSWVVNGSVVQFGSTYTVSSSDASPGDTVECHATATDQHGGIATDIASVTVLNANPVVDTVVINPDPGYNDSVFDCTANATDSDGSIASLDFTWTDGSGTILATGPVFDSNTVTMFPGQTIACTAVATDDMGATDSSSLSLALTNRAPNTPNVYITWNRVSSFPQTGDTLTCNATLSSQYDPDGTPVSISYGWFSSAYNAPTTGQTMPGSYVYAGELYTCNVTLSDGSLSSNGFDTVQATTPDGTQIQSAATLALESTCGNTNCDWSLELPDLSRMDFVTVAGGFDSLNQYELSNSILVATTETTQKSGLALVGRTVSDYGSTQDSQGSFGVGDEYPLYNTTWHQAAWIANAATNWHNQSTGEGLQECFVCSGFALTAICSAVVDYTQCTGYRLPTDGEWEYLARSGSTLEFWTEDGSAVASAADTCTGAETLVDGVIDPLASVYANYCGSATYGTVEVASLSPNGFGLFDVHGNVAEWTADDAGCAFPANVLDPMCVVGATDKVLRGGSWVDTLLDQGASAAVTASANTVSSTIGFRLVRTQ